MNQLAKIPPVQWALHHPRLAAWIVLSLGMVILLVVEAKDVGLLATQWLALVVATVLVAGACVWIISWEDSDEAVESEALTPAPTEVEPTKAAEVVEQK